MYRCRSGAPLLGRCMRVDIQKLCPGSLRDLFTSLGLEVLRMTATYVTHLQTSVRTHFAEMNTLYIVIEVVIAVLSISGNVLVCWAVAINSTLKNATYYFLVSLAVADILVGCLAIPFAIIISIGLRLNFYGCLFLACFVLVLTQSSIFSLLAIAIDRYLAVKIPLR
ncbi:Adenosine receptor A2b [Xenoophorus captivus]|uniref:Adenosine receptor A2b n=1 Tax=Xenoophorus captivus TaxID=1517983 RepID=A0ABV0RCX4_9TELE